MQLKYIIPFLLISPSLKSQTFFLGHNETISDSINRAWYSFELVDSLVFPQDKDFIIVSQNKKPQDFISQTEKKYTEYSRRKPDSKESMSKWYPDSSHVNYLQNFNKKMNEYRLYAKVEHDFNTRLTKLLYIQNKTNDTMRFPTQDGSLIAILEAKDHEMIWNPIEFWWYSWCGNSYSWIELLPGQTIKIGLNNKLGTIKTDLRFKIHGNDTIFTSKKFEGYINPTQFKLTSEVKEIMKDRYNGISFLDTVHYGLCEKNDGAEEIEIDEE